MKSKTLLTSQKPFYKGNMHAHSTFSDGSQTPWELKALYKSHGYSFIAITDHEVVYDHSYLDDDGFITITGAEYGIKEDITKSVFKNPDMKVCHLNLYAKEQHNAQSICYCPKLDRYSDAGQKLVKSTLKKIEVLREYLDKNGYEHIEIEVDGNVSFENATLMSTAGANIFVAGTSSVFEKSNSLEDNIKKFRSVI